MKKRIAVAVMTLGLCLTGCGLLDSGLTSKTSGFIPPTTKDLTGKSSQEIFTSFGPPAQRFKSDKGEIWIYVRKQEKNLKVLGVGKKSSSCKCVSVVFNHDEVVGTKGPYPCSCRLLSQSQPD